MDHKELEGKRNQLSFPTSANDFLSSCHHSSNWGHAHKPHPLALMYVPFNPKDTEATLHCISIDSLLNVTYGT